MQLLEIRESDLPIDGRDGAFHMALDSVLSEEFSRDVILRIYQFSQPTITLGVHQNPECLDQQSLESHGVDVSRRVTGGKALLHYKGLTYSILIPRDHPKAVGNVVESYKVLSQPVFQAVRKFNPGLKFECLKKPELDTPICFLDHDVETIALDRSKIVGSAQKRNRKVILQHGEISLVKPSMNPTEFFLSEGVVEHLDEMYANRVGYLFQDMTRMDHGAYFRYKTQVFNLRSRMIEEFEKVFGKSQRVWLESPLLEKVKARARELDLSGKLLGTAEGVGVNLRPLDLSRVPLRN